MLDTLLHLAMALFLLQHLIAPLIVWRQQFIPARYRLPRIADDSFFAARDQTFHDLHDKLLALEFQYLASSSTAANQVDIYFSIYRAPDNSVIACLVTMINAISNMTYVEFTQVYSDGSVLNINNSPILAVYPPSPLKLMVRLPDLQDPADLYAVMRQLRQQLSNSAELTSLREGAELDEIAFYLNREAEDLIQRGYYAKESQENQRYLTLFGAFAFTWKLLWPWKMWFDWQDARQARRLLRR